MWNYDEERKKGIEPNSEKKGAKRLEAQNDAVMATGSAMGTNLKIQQANMVFTYGAKFAETTVIMEKTMMDFAKASLPLATKGLEGLNLVAKDLSKAFSGISDILDSKKSFGQKLKEILLYKVQ